MYNSFLKLTFENEGQFESLPDCRGLVVNLQAAFNCIKSSSAFVEILLPDMIKLGYRQQSDRSEYLPDELR